MSHRKTARQPEATGIHPCVNRFSLTVHTLSYSPSKRDLPHAKQGASRLCFCLLYKLQIFTVFNSGSLADNHANITSQTESKMPETSSKCLVIPKANCKVRRTQEYLFILKCLETCTNLIQFQERQTYVSTLSKLKAKRSWGQWLTRFYIKPNEDSKYNSDKMFGSWLSPLSYLQEER